MLKHYFSEMCLLGANANAVDDTSNPNEPVDVGRSG